MQTITLTSKNRLCVNPYAFLGYEGENKVEVLEFKFTDGFVDGLGQLYIKRGEDIGYVTLDKKNETYELPIKMSLVSKVGTVTMQVVITKTDGTIIKYDKFSMLVKDAIDTDVPLPEDYPSWTSTISEMLAQAQEAIDEANAVSEQLLKDKADGAFDGKDGKDGKDGIVGKDGVSPTVKTEQTSTGATIEITDVDGTHTVELTNGKDGKDGIQEETDPKYTADKPNLATKSELPTKLSELTNDTGFITKTVNDLANYYTKSETYSKTEVNNLISNIKSLDVEVVESLPEAGNTNTLYLLAQDRQAPDVYDEYLYVNGAWERIGSTAVDLTNYYTKEQVDSLIPVVPTKVSELENDKGYISGYTETDPTVPTHVKSITEANINSWNNKSDFSGDYNDLTNKPTIPSVDGLATIEQLTQGLATKQNTLTAGENITIVGDVISATGSEITADDLIKDWNEIDPDSTKYILNRPLGYKMYGRYYPTKSLKQADFTLDSGTGNYVYTLLDSEIPGAFENVKAPGIEVKINGGSYTEVDKSTVSNCFSNNVSPADGYILTDLTLADGIVLNMENMVHYAETVKDGTISITPTVYNSLSSLQVEINAFRKEKSYLNGEDITKATSTSYGVVMVDSEMSDTSENAVQNKVIKAYVDGLVGNVETALQAINSGSGV